MSRPAITVDNVSKAYRIGLKDQHPDSLVGAMQGMLTAPWKNWRRLSRLNTFRHQEDSDDLFWALRDVSFEVQEGEVVGIIGRNGAGKSTLLKILSRITEPTRGRAVTHGRVSSLLEVGTGFHPELSGRDNIYMNGTILGMTKREIDRKFDEIIEFSGVEKFLETPIKHYSSGMKVRLAFSVAAHLEPEILIIDEVLAVGDAEFQKKCLGKMQDVAGSGRTVLFVSHNMAAVEALCTGGVELQNGRIVMVGPISDVAAGYQQRALDACATADHVLDHTRFIREVRVIAPDGRRTTVAPIGQDLRLHIMFEPERPVRYPRVFLGLDDAFGNRVLTVQPPAHSNVLGELEGPTTVVCIIPEFPLAPGSYLLNVQLMENREVLEHVQNCGAVTVIDAPLFDEGRGFSRGHCAARSNWGRFVSSEIAV